MAIGAISSSQNVEYTGSFSKLLVTSASYGNTNIAVFSKIVYGKLTTPFQGTGSATNIVSNVECPIGTYIEGPIQSFKLAATGGAVLAYYSDLY